MASTLSARVTREDFFALCERSEANLEYVDGQVVAMARGSFNHATLVSGLGRLVGNAVEGGTCRSYTDRLSVYIETFDAIRTPDIVVACPPHVINARQGIIDNPIVLVEVTSPATGDIDRSDKLREYASLSSVRHYVLVHSERVLVEIFSRADDGTWRFELMLERDETLRLPTISFMLPLADLYDGVVFETVNSSTRMSFDLTS